MGGAVDERRLCAELGALEEGRSKAALRHLLLTSSLVDSLVELLHAACAKLSKSMARQRAAATEGEHDKYLQRQDSILPLSYGGISTFYKGLEGFLGSTAPPQSTRTARRYWRARARAAG